MSSRSSKSHKPTRDSLILPQAIKLVVIESNQLAYMFYVLIGERTLNERKREKRSKDKETRPPICM